MADSSKSKVANSLGEPKSLPLVKIKPPAGYMIDKYEVPKEYHEAVFEAYLEGAKRGFIDASIKELLK